MVSLEDSNSFLTSQNWKKKPGVEIGGFFGDKISDVFDQLFFSLL